MSKPVRRFPATMPGSGAAREAATLLRPQRLLHEAAREAARGHEAAREAARQTSPSGIGLDSAAVRARMVDKLRAAGLSQPAVLAAFNAVPRHQFVDAGLATQAYEDTALPIGLGQTISKPSVVARMLSLLFDGATARRTGSLGQVLEVGTGCGYQAALLSLMARRVISVERLKPLHDKARENLHALRPSHLRLVYGDGRRGHPPNAPYDSIIAAAGGEDVPAAWLEQLADGGRLIAPMHDAKLGGQVLVVIDKHGDTTTRTSVDAVHFVPLKSGTA